MNYFAYSFVGNTKCLYRREREGKRTSILTLNSKLVYNQIFAGGSTTQIWTFSDIRDKLRQEEREHVEVDRSDRWMAGWIKWIAWMLLTDHKAVTCRRRSIRPRFRSVGSLVQYLFYIVLIHGNLLNKCISIVISAVTTIKLTTINCLCLLWWTSNGPLC